MQETDEPGAKRLRAASTHWLRHTYASHRMARGATVETTRDNLGHASLATTTVYVTTEKKRRMKEVQAESVG
jgi:site-specific recombinase XerD